MRRVAVALVALLCLGGPAASQDAAVVEELVVRAYGGPPWWSVSDGDSTVYVLALIGATPKGQGWDKTLLDKRMTGAKTLVLPVEIPPSRGSAADVRRMKSYATVRPGQRPLEERLPPALRARFVARREALGQPAQRYAGYPAGAAAMLLAGDVFSNWGLRAPMPRGDEVLPIVRAAARAKKVRTQTPRFSGPFWTVREQISDLMGADDACATAILDELDKGRPRTPSTEDYRRIQRAWAEGDVRPTLEYVAVQERELRMGYGKDMFWIPAGAWQACSRRMPFAAVKHPQTGVKDTVAAFNQQLKRPGHSVAVVPPWHLLSRGGVLDQLRRQGYRVTTPASQDAG